MASEDTTLIVGLEARVDAFEKAFNRAGSIADTKFSRIERRAKQASDRLRDEMGKAGDGIEKVFGAIGVGFGLRELQEIADAYTNMAASIRAASASAGEAKAVHEELAKAADRARTSVDALGGMFLKAKVSLDEHNVSVATQLKMAEAVATEYRRDGASAEDAANAYQKLVRAMIEGGDQSKTFNAIFMQAPDLLRDLAAASGETMEQLKADFAAGDETIFKLVPALKAVGSTASTELSKVPLTIGDAFTKVQNALNEFIGEAASTSGATRLITDGLDAVASNMDKVAPAALLVGGLLAGKVAAGFLLSNASAITFLGSIGLVVAALEKLQSFMASTKAAGLDWRDDWLAFSASLGNDAARDELRQRMQAKKDAGTLHLEKLDGMGGSTPGMSDIAGKAAADLKAAVQVIDRTLKSLTGDASSASAGGKGAASPSHPHTLTPASGLPSDDSRMTDTTGDLAAWKKDEEAMQERINLMKAETAMRAGFVGTFEEEAAAVDRARVAQDLLNKAHEAHIQIAPEVEASIASLASAYENASTQAAALAKTEAEAKQNAKELSDASGGAIKGFVSDLAHGKSAAEALRDALSKLAEKMFDMGFDGLWKQLTNNGQAFEGLGRMLTPAEQPAALPAMGAGEVKKLADASGFKTVETAHVTVNAGNADINGQGGIGSDAKFATTGDTGDADRLAAAGKIDTAATLTDKTPIAALGAGAGGLALHDRNLGAGFGGGAPTAALKAASSILGVPATRSTADAAGRMAYSRGVQNFNPTNIAYGAFAKAHGSTGGFGQDQDHLVAVFPDYQTGLDAARRLALGKYNGGKLSADDLIAGKNGWTPGNHQAAANVAATMGIKPSDDMQLTDPAKMQSFLTALTKQEVGPQGANYIFGGATGAAPLASATQDITKLGGAASSATGDLTSFGGSLGGLAKSLMSGLGGGGGGLGLGGAGDLASLFGFADGGLIDGAGSGTSDSNLARVSNGEYIVNARAAAKHMALLNAINSGKTPKLAGAGGSAFLTHNAYSPTVNVHVDGGAADRNLAARIAEHVTKGVNASARGFRFSGPQSHAAAHATISRAAHKNG